MTKLRIFAEGIIYDLIAFAMLYGFFVIPAMFFIEDGNGSRWMLVAILPFACNFISRRYIKNTALMLLAHLIVSTIFLFFVPLFSLFFAVILVIAMNVYSMIQRTKNRVALELTAFFLMSAMLVALCFIALFLDFNEAAIIYPILIIIVIIGGELHRRMCKVDDSLEVITKTSTQPIRQILKFDSKILLALAITLVIITAISYFAILNPLLSQLSDIRTPRQEVEFRPDDSVFTPPPATLPATEDWTQDFGPAREPNPFWRFLENILFFIVQIAMVVLPIIVVVAILISIYKMLAYKQKSPHHEDGGDVKEFILTEGLRPKMKNLFDYFHWNEDKTRRAFRKKIQRHRKLGVALNKFQSPEEMVEVIQNSAQPEDISELANAYREIRYGLSSK